VRQVGQLPRIMIFCWQ